MQSGFILTHFFYCPSAVVKGSNLPIDIVTSTFFRKIFLSIFVLLWSKLSLFAKQCSLLVCCFLKKLLILEWIDIIRLLTFEWINFIQLLPERPFSCSMQCMFFSVCTKVIPLKFNREKNLESLTPEFSSR